MPHAGTQARERPTAPGFAVSCAGEVVRAAVKSLHPCRANPVTSSPARGGKRASGRGLEQEITVNSGVIRAESELGAGSRFIITLKAGTAHFPPGQIDETDDSSPAGRTAEPYAQEALQWLPAPDEGSDETEAMLPGAAESPARPRCGQPAAPRGPSR